MIVCACGKSMTKVPSWLESTSITFVCNNCPNRTVKSIAQVQIEPAKEPSQSDLGAIEAENEGETDDD